MEMCMFNEIYKYKVFVSQTQVAMSSTSCVTVIFLDDKFIADMRTPLNSICMSYGVIDTRDTPNNTIVLENLLMGRVVVYTVDQHIYQRIISKNISVVSSNVIKGLTPFNNIVVLLNEKAETVNYHYI